MAVIALVVSVLAFGFAIASFWWLNARRGSVTAVVPAVYAFVEGFRLRFPVAVFNDGAVALLITDLRIVVSDAGTFPWQTTRTRLKPASDDGHEFATPFSVKGAIRLKSLPSSAATSIGCQSREPPMRFDSKGWCIRRTPGPSS